MGSDMGRQRNGRKKWWLAIELCLSVCRDEARPSPSTGFAPFSPVSLSTVIITMSDPLSTPAQTAQDTGPLAPLQPVTQTRSDRSYSVSATATFPAADYSRAPSIQLNASSLVNPAAAADNSGTDPFDLSDELGGEDDEDDTASRRTGRSTGRSTPTTRSSIPTPPPSRMSSIAPSPRTHTPVTTQHFQMSSSSSPRSHSRVPSPVRAAQSMRHHPSSNNTRSAPGSRSISPSQGGATGEHPLEWKRSPTLPVLAPTLIQPGMFVALPQVSLRRNAHAICQSD